MSESAASEHRLISMSRGGRHVAVRNADGPRLLDGIEIVDALGTARRVTIDVEDICDFACVGNTLWVVANGVLRRFGLDGSGELESHKLGSNGIGTLRAAQSESQSALWLGNERLLFRQTDDELAVDDVSKTAPPGSFAAPLAGTRLLVAEDRQVSIRDVKRGNIATGVLPSGGKVVAGSGLFGGRVLAFLSLEEDASAFDVLKPSGSLVHHIEMPPARLSAIAESRGIALVYTIDRNLFVVDLRYGRLLGRTEPPMIVEDLAIDANGRYITLAGYRSTGGALSVLHIPYTDLFGPLFRTLRDDERKMVYAHPPADESDDYKAEDSEEEGEAQKGTIQSASPEVLRDSLTESESEPLPDDEDEEAEPPAPIEIPDVPLKALGWHDRTVTIEAPKGVEPFESPRAHLSHLLDLVAARAARAIADAWDSGRLSMPSEDKRPFEREVAALVGGRIDAATDLLEQASRRVKELSEQLSLRTKATMAIGRSLPLVEIAREFDLSTAAVEVLSVAAAPSLRGEIARLYGVLANDEGRPICDRYLIELVLGGSESTARSAVARELENNAPLEMYGLVRILPAPKDHYLFAPVTVEAVLLSRLRGDPFAIDPGGVSNIRKPDRDLPELAIPDELKLELIVDLAEPTPADKPVRLVLRGRPGSGRTTLLAALASRADRPLAVIDTERLPRGRAFPAKLRTELRLAVLRGAIPCVSGIEVFDREDVEGHEHVREVFRTHPGPIVFRTTPEFRLPLDPGYLGYAIPALNESQRLDFWTEALGRRNLNATGAAIMASRYRIGPGTIERVISTVASRRALESDPNGDLTADLDNAARQHIDARLGNVATHITRLAKWEQVALPDDVLDSIKEFIGRIKHRRTVYDDWGFDQKMSTSRGLTALFYGPPGTGKSMVAGLMSRELGLDLYRVDLARITSKWIGETEKNLGQVFDAAEDGQALILFDEADSLFAKRTEVKSSVDRYANLEVNYLLQRLDTFEGVAILTTNMEGSIDKAFMRRISLRLSFPFPDEDMRIRLWAAHIPPQVPTLGDFDFASLASRYPMSGGYIRNSALRAAFLAAQEGVPLSQKHLERAIQLEYREMGKLSASGRME